MSRTTLVRVTAVAIIAFVALGATGAGTAGAAVTADSSSGFVRVGHFAPGQGPVNVLVDGKVAVRNFGYRDVTDYLKLPAGQHKFALQDPGADGSTLLSVDAGVPADGAVTIGAVTTRTGLAVQVYDDDLEAPAPGDSLVRFIHTAPAASAVKVSVVGGADLVKSLGYPDATGYMSVKAGTYDLAVTSIDTGKVVLDIPGWAAKAGSQSSVVLIQTPDGQIDAVPVSDAVGVRKAPDGGMATGLGGLAREHHGSDTASIVAMIVGIVALLAASGLFAGRLLRHRS